ncbi:MAG: TlpA family protein disulfide reductase [Nevskiaceae bacterium]|jgi:peroxiredoxin|nr:MAG: TlpA family protein disulfide reductase [Nevskiaceae bacterium]TAM28201.1 MAG: TlpA family protein disulfide reductase [Nevskiaceae bacterium]
MSHSIRKPLLRGLAIASLALGLAAPALAVKPGETAPTFTLPKVGGGTVSLADYQGQVVYLDFWASWCGPCRQSFPWMKDMQARYGAQGLRVLAVNVDGKSSDAEAFLAQFPNLGFSIALDSKGATPSAYQIKGMPTSFLIGPDGKVLLVHQSFKDSDREDLQAQLAAAVAANGKGKQP